MKVTDTITFKQKANARHNNYYSYDKVVFVDSVQKIIITCPIHGDFKQRPNNHITGYGCSQCARINRSRSQTMSKEMFIKKANTIHCNTYDYSGVVYKNNRTAVNIKCFTHGEFFQTPSNHLHKTRPQGCPTCGVMARSALKKLTKDEFVFRSKETHLSKYNYDAAVYIDFHTHVEITCAVHGNFWQTPAHHLNGTGCPHCAKHGFNKAKSAILYYLSINNGQAYKIGITNRTLNERFNLSDLKKIEVIKTWTLDGENAYSIEQQILRKNCEHKYKGFPLLTDGNTELFAIDIIDDIISILQADLHGLSTDASLDEITTILETL